MESTRVNPTRLPSVARRCVPATVAHFALDALEAGEIEIVADGRSANIRAALAAGARALYPQFA